MSVCCAFAHMLNTSLADIVLVCTFHAWVAYVCFVYLLFVCFLYYLDCVYFACMLHILYLCVTMMCLLFYDACVYTFYGSQAKDFVNR